jgi:hypothetical protein
MEQWAPDLAELAVEIVRFVDDCQPGIVACEFVDSDDRRHTLIGKIPIFSDDSFLDANSKYPQQGTVRCTVLNHGRDARGRELVSISTALGAQHDELRQFFGRLDTVRLKRRRFPVAIGNITPKVGWFGLTTSRSVPEKIQSRDEC